MTDDKMNYTPELQINLNENNAESDLRLLSINQSRNILHIRYEAMKNLIESGKIRYLNLEGTIKIPYFELKEFLQNNLIRINNSEEKDSLESEEKINNILLKYKNNHGNNICTKG